MKQDLLHTYLTPVKKRQCIRDEKQQHPIVIILSRFSFELGWKVPRKRGTNKWGIMELDVGYYGDVRMATMSSCRDREDISI